MFIILPEGPTAQAKTVGVHWRIITYFSHAFQKLGSKQQKNEDKSSFCFRFFFFYSFYLEDSWSQNIMKQKAKAYPNESSKTKGSMPVRLLSVSVQIWLQQTIQKIRVRLLSNQNAIIERKEDVRWSKETFSYWDNHLVFLQWKVNLQIVLLRSVSCVTLDIR